MSRCFPYPQHDCFAKIAANDSLIDSIKIQREAEKAAKAERKKARELKKALRRSEKKETTTLDQLGKRKVRDEKPHNLGCGKDDDPTKCNFENLERSNITEELGKPSNYQNPCSSDSSENSIRRKRHATLESGIRTNGSLLKIRLAPQKSKDSVELLDHLTLPAGRTEVIDHKSSSLDKKMKLVSLLYKDIVSDFAPLRHGSCSLSNEADNSWLLERRDAQRCNLKSDMLGRYGSSTMRAKASYLPEVELYALPFVVPF